MNPNRPVLAADDNPDDLRLLQFAWERSRVPAPLQVVDGGEEAIAYFLGEGLFADRERFPLPCLALLDLKMPRKDGFDVLQFIRSHHPVRLLPVVVLTASLHTNDVVRAFELGTNAFLVKPVELEKLIALTQCLSAFWLQHNQCPPIG